MTLTTSTVTDPRNATTWEEFKEVSRKLDRYYRRDYSPINPILQTLFPKSFVRGQLHVRPSPFIYSYAREMATAYVQAPTRRFVGIENEATLEMIQGAYKRMGVNASMRVVDEMLWVQENACVLTMPDSKGKLAIHVLPPWRVEPITQDAMVVDPRSIDEWRITLPRVRLTTRNTAATVEDALVLTGGKATWEQQKKGAWNGSGKNPVKTIPLIIARAGEPEPGCFYAPLPDDLLGVQEALIIDHTDAGRAALFALGQKVVKGMSETEVAELIYGPDVAIGLEKDQNFEIVSADPGIQYMQQATNGYLSHVLGMLKVDPGAFVRSTTLTAAAKIAEKADRENERRLHAETLIEVEQRLYRHIARWTNAQRDQSGEAPVMPVTGITVEVEHQEVRPVMDPLHEAQAAALRVKMGLVHPAELIAKERGIDIEKAKTIYEANRKAYAELQAALGQAGENLDDGLDNSAGGGS